MATGLSYAFDPSKGETPESLKRKRRMAEALMGSAASAPRNVGEGLNSIGQALLYRSLAAKADAGEKAGLASGQKSMGGIIDALGLGKFPARPSANGNVPSPDGSVPLPEADVASARGAQAHGDFDVRQGLIDRGMSPHIADAFVMNFQDESGLNPGINEANPIVPGSRGGFGLSQWTGPRRRALEAYAAERGLPVDDGNMQLDYLMTELQGPEAAAWQAIQSAPDTGSAAAAIVNQFLRPAEQHRAAREARYLGGGGAPSQAVASSLTRAPINADLPMMGGGGMGPATALTSSQPPANASRLEMSGNVDIPQPTGPTMQQLAQALGNPFLPDGFRPIAQGMLDQQMQQMDPRYQLDLDYRRAQTAKLQGEATGAGQAELGLNPQYGVDAQGNPVLIQIGKDGRAVQTAMPDGVSLSKEPIKMDAGTHFVLLDPITRQPVGRVPKDNYQEAFDKGAGGAAGKAQAEAAANLPTDLATAEQAITELDQLINHPGLPDIAGSFDQYRPSWTMGAEGKDALARFNQAKGRAFLQAFGMLKGGGQITEIEGLKAEQAMARMDRAQGEAEFKQALIDFRDAVKTGMDKMRQRAGGAVPTADYAPNASPEANGNTPAPEGVDPADWEFMSPEDRKLFQ